LTSSKHQVCELRIHSRKTQCWARCCCLYSTGQDELQ